MGLDDRSDPLSDVFNLFAAPLAGTIRSFEQFRKGVDEFLKGVENFNRTMENLNETSERINALLADIELPIRAAIPQVTRTVRAADEMMQVISGPAMAVAPGLNRLAETLGTPAFAQLPHQLGQFSDLLGEVSKRLAPLTQLAESAGGLFGGFRIPGVPGGRTSPPVQPTAAAAPSPTAPAPAPSTSSSQRSTSSDSARADSGAGRTASKTAPAKKSAAKKSAAKKSSAKRSAARKSTANRSTAKKSAAKKSSASGRSAGS
jgi:hypothetical protein